MNVCLIDIYLSFLIRSSETKLIVIACTAPRAVIPATPLCMCEHGTRSSGWVTVYHYLVKEVRLNMFGFLSASGFVCSDVAQNVYLPGTYPHTMVSTFLWYLFSTPLSASETAASPTL